MKKTIALLLAAASMAMGATPMNITWEDNAAFLGTGINQFTTVFTLDLTGLYNAERQDIMTYTSNKSTYRYGLVNEYTFYNPGDIDSKIKDVSYLKTNEGQLVNCNAGYKYPNATTAIIAYIFGGESESIQLTLYNAAGGIEYEYSKSITLEPGLNSISYMYKNDAVGKIDVYDTALQGDEITAAIEYLKNPTIQPDGPDTPVEPSEPAVPEPTTATLSLLALSALAARRRRK